MVEVSAWVLTAETGDSRWIVLITSWTAIIVAFFGMIVMIAPHAGKAGVAIVNAAYPIVQLVWKQRDELLGQTRKLQQDLAENTRITAEAQETARKLGEEAKEAARRNTETIERLLEQNQKLAEQNEKLQATIEDDRESTEKARRMLHTIRDEFNTATIAHRQQREALITQLGAVTESLNEARAEIAEFHRRERASLNSVVADQARQDTRISVTQAGVVENKAAIVETKADIERMKQASSGEMLVVKIDPEPEP